MNLRPPRRALPALLLAALAWAGSVHAHESVRTLAGEAGSPGHGDGLGAAARFSDPTALATDVAGNLFIADSANHCIRRLALNGQVTTTAGTPGIAGSRDGVAGTARFDTPSGLALAADGTLFVSDTGNHTIRRISSSGVVSTLAGVAGDPGPTNGPARTARFNAPLGLALGAGGVLFVADSANHALRRVTPDGTVSTFAGQTEEWGAVDGPAATARFNGPVGLAWDRHGRLVVADSLNHALRGVTSEGTVTTLAGQLGEDGGLDGPAAEARFCKPAEIHPDAAGNLYIVDAFNHVLRKLDTRGFVATVAGLAGVGGSTDGANGQGRFFNPYGLVVRPAGSLVVSDTYNQTLREVLAPFTLWAPRTAAGEPRTVRWESVVGRRYQLLARDRWTDPWLPVGAPQVATSLESVQTDPAPGGKRFYQVERSE